MIVHRIGPGPVLQSPTRGWFQTAHRLSEPRWPLASLFFDRRAAPAVYRPRCGFPRPRVPPSRSPILSASSTPKASLSCSPLHASHRTPLPFKHRHADRPLRPSPEAAFTATTSAQAHCRSLTSEPTPFATPLACRRWCPSTRTCCRGRPRYGELLHPPLLSSIHRGHNTLLPPSPFFLAQEHRKELDATTTPLLRPPRHPSPVRASLPAPFSIPRR
jgi:hypothetical protein